MTIADAILIVSGLTGSRAECRDCGWSVEGTSRVDALAEAETHRCAAETAEPCGSCGEITDPEYQITDDEGNTYCEGCWQPMSSFER